MGGRQPKRAGNPLSELQDRRQGVSRLLAPYLRLPRPRRISAAVARVGAVTNRVAIFCTSRVPRELP